MNTLSDSRADESVSEKQNRKILVWDAPVRIFHWLMVLSFAGAYLTAESERWRLVHVTLGYTMAGLVIFRLLWGLIGTRYARFSSFIRGPKDVVSYLGNLLRGKAKHYVGHNPAGALAIVALLILTIAVGISGWATYNDFGGHWLEEAHEALAATMLTLVGIHIAGVIVSSWLHRENLVGAMLTGKKRGSAQDGIRAAWRSVAAIMLVAVLGFWILQWQGGGSGSTFFDRPVASAKSGQHHDED